MKNLEGPGAPSRRTRMPRPYPSVSLEEAVAVPRAIHTANSGFPMDRGLLAGTLGTTSSSSRFTTLLNASAQYGLTVGGYRSAEVGLTARGEAIVAPKGRTELRQALVEAALEPELFRRFYERLDSRPIPEDFYAANMVQRELAVRPELAPECLAILKANGLYAAVLHDSGKALHVRLDLTRPGSRSAAPVPPAPDAETGPTPTAAPARPTTPNGEEAAGRIFVGYLGPPDGVGFVEAVMNALAIPHAVGAATEAGGPPLSEDLLREMRRCTAAVLVLPEPAASEVLAPARSRALDYLLGAAWALFHGRVIAVLPAVPPSCPLPEGLTTVRRDAPDAPHAGFTLLQALSQVGAIRILAQG